jgi:hypothetical protein
MKTEWAIHRCFADAHIHYEWFRATPRLLAAIEKIANGMPVADAIDLTKPLGEIRPRYSRRRLEAAE